MKKKVFASLICLVLVFLSVFAFGCADKRLGKTCVADKSLYGKSYIDYATEVKFDTQAHPELATQGLFWVNYNAEANNVEYYKADTAEGAKIIDKNKPTIIIAHGILLSGGHSNYDEFYVNSKIASASEYGLSGNSLSVFELYQKQGYNVGEINYNMFADETNTLNAPNFIECKIWGTNGGAGTHYRKKDGTISVKDVSPYSLTEHFIADYIRAVKLIDGFGEKEVSIAGHSMGGQVVTAFTFFATEMADVGQLPRSAVPNRLILLDPYFSSPDLPSMCNPDLIVRWSNKKILNGSTGYAMVECLKEVTTFGIAVEYYTEYRSALVASSTSIQPEIKKYCVYTTLDISYTQNGFSPSTEGHNAVREWYFVSKLFDEPKCGDATCVSAKSTTERIRQQIGCEYKQTVVGSDTLICTDDNFTKIIKNN
ncbi:MAG: hypothetical protein RR123_06300 [Clostridia bacterium]